MTNKTTLRQQVEAEIEKTVEETWEKILSQMDWTDEVYRKFGNSEQKIEALQESLWDYLQKQFEKIVMPYAKRCEEATEEVKRLDALVYLPNHWQCPKCNFYQVNLILAPEGIFADKKTPEQCPNDGTEMMPVSWKQNAQDGRTVQDRLMQIINEKDKAIFRLRECCKNNFVAYHEHGATSGKEVDEKFEEWMKLVGACEISDIEREIASLTKRLEALEKENAELRKKGAE